MPKMSNSVKKGLIAAGVLVAGAVNAQAALTVDPVSTTDFMTVAGVVVTALGIFYGVRKALGLFGK